MYDFFLRFPLEVYGNECDVDSEGDEDLLLYDAFSDAEAILASCIGELDHMMVSVPLVWVLFPIPLNAVSFIVWKLIVCI